MPQQYQQHQHQHQILEQQHQQFLKSEIDEIEVAAQYWLLVESLIDVILITAEHLSHAHDRQFYLSEMEQVMRAAEIGALQKCDKLANSTLNPMTSPTMASSTNIDLTSSSSEHIAREESNSELEQNAVQEGTSAQSTLFHLDHKLQFAMVIVGLTRVAFHIQKTLLTELMEIDVRHQQFRFFSIPIRLHMLLSTHMQTTRKQIKYCTIQLRHLRTVKNELLQHERDVLDGSNIGSHTQKMDLLPLLLLRGDEKQSLMDRDPLLFLFVPICKGLQEQWDSTYREAFNFFSSTIRTIMSQQSSSFWIKHGVNLLHEQNVMLEWAIKVYRRDVKSGIVLPIKNILQHIKNIESMVQAV